jgi:ribokinase
VVLQFEIPLETVLDAAGRFRAAGAHVVVNFSPVTEGSRVVLPHTEVLVVNEAEAAALRHQVAAATPATTPSEMEVTLDVLRTCDVVVTLGGRGLMAMSRTGEIRQYRAHEVQTVNALGAGDVFLAMLVSRLAQGEPFLDGLAAAGAAGALACSRRESWLSRGDAPRLNEMMQDRTVLAPGSSRADELLEPDRRRGRG